MIYEFAVYLAVLNGEKFWYMKCTQATFRAGDDSSCSCQYIILPK